MLAAALGEPPVDDSLAAVNWMQRALTAMAGLVIKDRDLDGPEKRAEILKIADRMAKLRDLDRMYRAEELLRGVRKQQEEPAQGAQLTNAPVVEGTARPVTARRGRPPSRSLP